MLELVMISLPLGLAFGNIDPVGWVSVSVENVFKETKSVYVKR